MNIEIFASEGTLDIMTYQDAIRAAEQAMPNNVIVPDFSQACIDREKQYPTGLKVVDGIGIAIPHGNSKLVKHGGISFVRLMKPVKFGLMEDATKQVECKFLFNLALEEGNQHLATLRKLMKLFQSKSFLQNIAELPIGLLDNYLKKNLK